MYFNFVSLGCDKNLVDSEIMVGLLLERGFLITDDPAKADIIIVNTCGFISDANKESVDMVLELTEYKTTGVCKALVVTGCMVSRYKDIVREQMPEIDAILGVDEYESIVETIYSVIPDKAALPAESGSRPPAGDFYMKRALSTPPYLAYLKIAEGCDNNCTYCTIPSIRGPYRSREMESIVREAKMLAERGVKEIVLVAQDTSLYGLDLYGENRLHTLLHEISLINGIRWIRLLYAYPEHITDLTIREISVNDKICKYLDIPVQSASDEVLKKMGRKSSRAALINIIKKLRKEIPGISLRTTLIAGFPGETEQNFKETVDFVTEIKFDKCGVFTYSKEDGTPAAKMDCQIKAITKKRRMRELMSVQQQISNELLKMLVGKKLTVIVDGKISDKNIYSGRSYRDSYEIDGVVFFECDEQLISGDFVDVIITHNTNYDLYGEIAHESESAE